VNQLDKRVVFLLKFFAIFSVLHYLLLVVNLRPMQEFIAKSQAMLLNLTYDGTLVRIGSETFEITPSCTGLVSSIILAAIVFSLKKPGLKSKTATLAIGVIFLLAANYVRVYFVLLSAIAFGGRAAEAVHIITWFLTAALVIVVWYYGTKRIAKVKEFNDFL